MSISKKDSLLTFISAAILLGMFATTNQAVHADTIKTPLVAKSQNENKQTIVAGQPAKDDKAATTAEQPENVQPKAEATKEKAEATKTADNNQTTTKNTQTQANKAVAPTTPQTTKTNDSKDSKKTTDKDTSKNQQEVQPTQTTPVEQEPTVFVPQSELPTDDSTTEKATKTDYQLSEEALKVLKEAEINVDSLTKDQVAKIKKINFNDTKANTAAKWTYSQYSGVANKMLKQDERYRIPYFNAKKIKNMGGITTKDAQTGKVADLEIWDSWPVQDAKTGKVVNYKGFQLAVAMMGIPQQDDSHIYLLYNKYGDNNFDNWKTAGPIFGYKGTPQAQEWSGSATVNKDGSIQLFYTDVDTSEGTNNQKISTVNLVLKVDNKKGTVKIAKRRYRHVLFTGDGYYYQTYKQWKDKNKGADNIAMRDAHVISVKGRRYLVFEASTGSQDYQGEDQVYKWQNYGGTEKEAIENFLKITSNADMTSRATWANAAIGIIRLSKNENNPKVDKVMSPLVSSLMVSDEIERANLIPMNGKYYLFATTRLNRGTGDDLWQEADQKIGDNVAMLGWVSDHLTYGYKPLNDDAGVLVASVPFNWRTSTYSYYPVPVKGSNDELLVTSYMTNRGFAAGAGKRSTLAPSFLIKIDGDKTYVENIATNQGVWDYNKKSKNNSMLVSTIKGAHLDGEPIDKSQWKNASLVSHIERTKKTSKKKSATNTNTKVKKVTNKKSPNKPLFKLTAPIKITAIRRTPVVGKDGKQVKTYMGSKKYNVIGKNITVNGLGTQKINGKTYYILQNGYYVLAKDFKLAGTLI